MRISDWSADVCSSDLSGLGRRLLDLLAMLVGAGEEIDVIAVEPLEAGQHVAGERGVGMPDVRIIVYVVDRGRDVVRRLSCRHRGSPSGDRKSIRLNFSH